MSHRHVCGGACRSRTASAEGSSSAAAGQLGRDGQVGGPDGLFDRRDRRRADRQLAHAQAEQQRNRERIGGKLAAYAGPAAGIGGRRGRAALSVRTPGCKASLRPATADTSRSAASVYWVRSLVPTEKKSTAGASQAAVSAAAGTSIMMPDFHAALGRHGDAFGGQSPARAGDQPERRAHLLLGGDHREHELHRMVRGHSQHGA